MLTAETTLRTTNASRYLVQLCQHATKVRHHFRHLHVRKVRERPEVLDVDWSDSHGTLSLTGGRCILDADATVLTVRVEAADHEHLRRVQDIIGADLERFGRREGLAVTWRPTQADEAS
jgi:hypothetical protein